MSTDGGEPSAAPHVLILGTLAEAAYLHDQAEGAETAVPRPVPGDLRPYKLIADTVAIVSTIDPVLGDADR